MELIRDLLMQIADGTIDNDSFDQRTIYHLQMLDQKGYISGIVFRQFDDEINFGISHELRLTFDGHEFSESIRPKKVWEKIKATINEKGLGLTVDAISKAAPAVIGRMLT